MPTGELIMSKWPCDIANYDSEGLIRYKLNWKESDRDKQISEYKSLYNNLKILALEFGNPDKEFENKAKLLTPDLFNVWNTYVKDVDFESIDMNLVEYISERIDTQDAIEAINEKIEQGEEIAEIEVEVVNDPGLIAISDEEREIYNEFLDR